MSIEAAEVKRSIKKEVERVLWTRAGGRCQFSGCNKLLYKSPITQEPVNIGEKAHIYSFSKDGPRGWGPFSVSRKGLNDVQNLMLLCHDCHKLIDDDKSGKRYSGEILLRWKRIHEFRIALVTGIDPEMNSHVVFYAAKIGTGAVTIQERNAYQAMFPSRFPSTEIAADLSLQEEEEDHSEKYWEIESGNLKKKYSRIVVPLIEEADPEHFSLFAIAPQPLLILLGSMFTDRINVDVYQLHREPQTWKWLEENSKDLIVMSEPDDKTKAPVLIISISAKIDQSRVTNILGEGLSIWELYTEHPGNDFMRSKDQLSEFRKTVRAIISDINKANTSSEGLSIFPAMPVSCAVELGRVRMPKADIPWVIYDQNNKSDGFIKTISIPEELK